MVLESVTNTPTDEKPRRYATPVSGRETPCERSLGATPNPKNLNRKELHVKVAEIVTGLETSKGAKERLTRETFAKMNRALEQTRRYKRAQTSMRDTRQQVWKYVNELSTSRTNSVTPTGMSRVCASRDMTNCHV